MTILAVEPNKNDLELLVNCLQKVCPEATVVDYNDSMLAFQYLFNNPVDVVFTAVEMKRLDGFTLAKMIRQSGKKPPICFIHKDEAYYTDAQRLMIGGYLTKPVTAAAIQEFIREDCQAAEA